MTNIQMKLTKHAVNFLKENYNMGLDVPIEINARLKRALGKVTYLSKSKKPSLISISKDLIENNSEEIVIDVLNHELVHYALMVLNKPFNDGDEYFEAELKRLGVISQSEVGKAVIKSNMQVYKCKDCNKQYRMTRRLKYNGLRHSCRCGGRLQDIGRMVV